VTAFSLAGSLCLMRHKSKPATSDLYAGLSHFITPCTEKVDSRLTGTLVELFYPAFFSKLQPDYIDNQYTIRTPSYVLHYWIYEGLPPMV
jgi:hypothetical protein